REDVSRGVFADPAVAPVEAERLKNHPHYQLRCSRGLCAVDDPEVGVAQRMAWNIEVLQVEYVEKFAANFRPHAFGDRESLRQVDVETVGRTATQHGTRRITKL